MELTLEAGAHTVHNLYYHIVWVPKYRRSILQGKVGERAKQVIHQVADEYGYTLDELKVSPDHIHILLKLQPKQAIPDVVRTLKSITARTLFQEFPDLKNHLWKGSLWAQGYCANTAGDLNLDAVRKYIREEQEEATPYSPRACSGGNYFRAPENLFKLMLRSSFTVNMPGTLDKAKKKIKAGAEKTEAEAKKAGGELKKAGRKSADEVKKVGHETKEKLRHKKS